MASNPVFDRIEKDARQGYAGFGNAPRDAAQAGPFAGTDYSTNQQLQDMYDRPPAGPLQTGRVTMDDVVMKSMTLFAIVIGVGAFGWVTADNNPALGQMFWMGGMVGTLVLGLVIAFKKVISVPLILAYAAVEGLFVGAVSNYFNDAFGPGLVSTAVIALKQLCDRGSRQMAGGDSALAHYCNLWHGHGAGPGHRRMDRRPLRNAHEFLCGGVYICLFESIYVFY